MTDAPKMDRSGEAVHGLIATNRSDLRTPDRSLCRCPDRCGLPVIGERWYAWKCPWRAEDLIRQRDLKRLANERLRRRRGMKPQENPARAKVNQQTYDRHDRWLADDIPEELIEQKFQEAKDAIRRARQTGQAA